jgi:hypothetical protein
VCPLRNGGSEPWCGRAKAGYVSAIIDRVSRQHPRASTRRRASPLARLRSASHVGILPLVTAAHVFAAGARVDYGFAFLMDRCLATWPAFVAGFSFHFSALASASRFLA